MSTAAWLALESGEEGRPRGVFPCWRPHETRSLKVENVLLRMRRRAVSHLPACLRMSMLVNAVA